MSSNSETKSDPHIYLSDEETIAENQPPTPVEIAMIAATLKSTSSDKGKNNYFVKQAIEFWQEACMELKFFKRDLGLGVKNRQEDRKEKLLLIPNSKSDQVRDWLRNTKDIPKKDQNMTIETILQWLGYANQGQLRDSYSVTVRELRRLLEKRRHERSLQRKKGRPTSKTPKTRQIKLKK